MEDADCNAGNAGRSLYQEASSTDKPATDMLNKAIGALKLIGNSKTRPVGT